MSLLKSVLYEKHTTQLADLTLREIIDAGKITNPYQLFVLGHVSEFVKNGCISADLHLENPITFNSNATSSELKSALLLLSDQEHVDLASYLLYCLSVGESLLKNEQSNTTDWIKFVLAKQH